MPCWSLIEDWGDSCCSDRTRGSTPVRKARVNDLQLQRVLFDLLFALTRLPNFVLDAEQGTDCRAMDRIVCVQGVP